MEEEGEEEEKGEEEQKQDDGDCNRAATDYSRDNRECQ